MNTTVAGIGPQYRGMHFGRAGGARVVTRTVRTGGGGGGASAKSLAFWKKQASNWKAIAEKRKARLEKITAAWKKRGAWIENRQNVIRTLQAKLKAK